MHEVQVRSPAQVYTFLVDQDDWATLDPATLDITPRGMVALCLSGTITRGPNGLRVKNGWLVTELDPSAKLAQRLVPVPH